MTSLTTSTQQQVQGGSFHCQSLAVLQRLRTALFTLIDALPGPPGKAADLQRALGLSTKLAWQIYRVAHSTNPLAEADQVPGASGMKQVLAAAAKAGIPAERIQAVADAMASFEELVRTHAQDRAMFTSMAESVGDPGEELLDVKTRRNFFRTGSQIWGTQTKASLRATLYMPGRRPHLMDEVTIRGAVDVLRLRPDATLHLTTHFQHTAPQDSGDNPTVGPLGQAKANDSDNTDAPSGLLTEFCSQPIPEFIHRRDGNTLITELQDQAIGKRGAFTYFVADHVRDVDWREPEPEGRVFKANMAIGRPAEVAILDVLVYDGMFGPLKPSAGVYATLFRPGSRPMWEYTERDRLPMAVKVISLGFGLAAMHTGDIPRYSDMISNVCQRMNVDPEKFEVFRCRVEYPIHHSLLSVTFPLPEQGNW